MRSSVVVCSLLVLLCTSAFGAGVSFSSTYYQTVGFNPGGTVAADLNRDGLPDFAVTNSQGTSQMEVFLATSAGKFGAEVDYPLPAANPDNVIAADLNGDGSLDLIVRYWHTAQLSILWNNGNGTFRSGPTVALSNPATFRVGDFNHDGKLDLATIECVDPAGSPCVLNIYLGNNTGKFTRVQSVTLAGGAGMDDVGDLNGDGNLDLVVNRTNQILLWWGKGNGTFAAPTYLSPGAPMWSSAVIGDFNNDGRLDVAVNAGSLCGSSCFNGATFVYKNMGGTTFSLASKFSGFAESGLFKADLNGDLNQDLVFVSGDQFGGNANGLLGNGNGTFQTTVHQLTQTDGWFYARDVDLDSRQDFVASDGLGGVVDVGLQTGGYKNCAPPSSAKLAAKICAPVSGSTAGSPVLVRASGNSPAGVVQLQIWIDGVKKAVRWHDQLANKFSLSSGTHRISVVASDKFLGTASSSINVTVP